MSLSLIKFITGQAILLPSKTGWRFLLMSEGLYYLYDVPGGAERGGHAHRKLQQLIVAASGCFDVVLDDGKNRKGR